MNRDDVIRMARDAGLRRFGPLNIDCELERFAERVAAHEREECAKILSKTDVSRLPDWWKMTLLPIIGGYADAIRARGTHEA